MMTLTILHKGKSVKQISNIIRFFPIHTDSGKELLYYETPNHLRGEGVTIPNENISSYELTCRVKGANFLL